MNIDFSLQIEDIEDGTGLNFYERLVRHAETKGKGVGVDANTFVVIAVTSLLFSITTI